MERRLLLEEGRWWTGSRGAHFEAEVENARIERPRTAQGGGNGGMAGGLNAFVEG